MEYQKASVISGGYTIQGICGWGINDVQTEGTARSYLHFLLEPPTSGNGVCLQGGFFEEIRLDKNFTETRQGDFNLVFRRRFQHWCELVERSEIRAAKH